MITYPTPSEQQAAANETVRHAFNSMPRDMFEGAVEAQGYTVKRKETK